MEDTEIIYLDNVKQARNRPDKSILAIKAMCPGKLLASDVAFPEQVKHLWLHTDGIFDYFDAECDCRITRTCTNNLVNFTQLETLQLRDINLTSDFLTQFAQNSKNLRDIRFKSYNEYNDADAFEFDGNYDPQTKTICHSKKKGLEAIFKIPLL